MLQPKFLQGLNVFSRRPFSFTTVCERKVAGRNRPTKDRSKPLTYEASKTPNLIAVEKTWNSWNTSALWERDLRRAETAAEDEFIRRFMHGTWHNLFESEVMIKRQHNIIRIAGIVYQGINQRKMYFLIGYTEELLSYWLQCIVKLELQTIRDRKDIIFKYV